MTITDKQYKGISNKVYWQIQNILNIVKVTKKAPLKTLEKQNSKS